MLPVAGHVRAGRKGNCCAGAGTGILKCPRHAKCASSMLQQSHVAVSQNLLVCNRAGAPSRDKVCNKSGFLRQGWRDKGRDKVHHIFIYECMHVYMCIYNVCVYIYIYM